MSHVHLPLTPDWLYWPLPWAGLLALLLVLPVLGWLWLRPSGRSALRFSDLEPLRVAGGEVWRWLRLTVPALRLAALACLIVAAARPQVPNTSRRTVVEGIAIQMVLDISSSMLDSDLSDGRELKTRLDVVKDVFRRFVAGDEHLPGRPNDLIGMIRFARYPDSVCPLTLDHAVLLDAVNETQTVIHMDGSGRWRGNRDEDGTAIGDGLALAVERLKDLKRTSGTGQQFVIRSRVVILLTDGENNAGMIAPEQAGELAAAYGIRVYTILAGTGQRTPWGERLPVNDAALRAIAEKTGGQYFHARDPRSLARIYGQIDALERTRTEEQSHVEWGELAGGWLLAAFVCLAAGTLLDATILIKVP